MNRYVNGYHAFPLFLGEVSAAPHRADGTELLYLSCATTKETFYLMVGFPGVFRVSSLHFITLLNTLASVVKNHVLPMILHDLEFNTLASVLRNNVFQ